MNAAQTILNALGAPVNQSQKMAHGNKKASATKAGSGRYHVAGHSKDSPRTSAGAPKGFVLHTASAAKRARKAAIKEFGGIRGFKRMVYADRDLLSKDA